MREWFAIKRSKNSNSYQFYVPDKRNRECIAAIAPDSGNYEEIILIEKSEYESLKGQAHALATRVDGMILSLQKNGQNIDVQFHISWLQKQLSTYHKFLKGKE